jgi:hypothetical protein
MSSNVKEAIKKKAVQAAVKPTPESAVKILQQANASLRRALSVKSIINSELKFKGGTPTKHVRINKTRLILPDSHGASLSQLAWGAVLRYAQANKISEIVMLGDHLDETWYLSKHQPSSIAEAGYCYADDIAIVEGMLDQLQEVAPDAIKYYIDGNHDHRTEKAIASMKKVPFEDKLLLNEHMNHASLLNFEERKIRHVKLTQRYDGLDFKGTLKLGHCMYRHYPPVTSVAHRAHQSALRMGGSIIYGHVHTQESALARVADGSVYYGGCPGCLSDLDPDWRNAQPTTWNWGFTVQDYNPRSGVFHTQNMLIDKDGKTYAEKVKN